MVGKKGSSGRKHRPALVWPERFTLETREDWLDFLRYLARVVLESKLDARVGGALRNTLRLIGDGAGWITKMPLQIIQAQVMQPGTMTETDLAELLSELPEDERGKLWEKAKERRLRNAVSRPAQS